MLRNIHSLGDLTFKKMLDIASRATGSITLPSPKKHAHALSICSSGKWFYSRLGLNVGLNILSLFLFSLMLTQQGTTVPGEISLTCDVWQADNTDRYFAVTGHWIEVHTPGECTLEHAVLGFAQMNCSHNGTHLGQMLYKIVNCL